TFEAPTEPVGTLVIREIARMTADSQKQLVEWLNDPDRSVRIIATSARSVFDEVDRGRFSDLLYYRINTVMLALNEAASPRDLPREDPIKMLCALRGAALAAQAAVAGSTRPDAA